MFWQKKQSSCLLFQANEVMSSNWARHVVWSWFGCLNHLPCRSFTTSPHFAVVTERWQRFPVASLKSPPITHFLSTFYLTAPNTRTSSIFDVRRCLLTRRTIRYINMRIVYLVSGVCGSNRRLSLPQRGGLRRAENLHVGNFHPNPKLNAHKS